MAKNRSIKVVSQSGYNYKATPTITLKGQWLKELGFDIGDWNGKQVYPEVAEGVNKTDTPFLVKVSIPDLNIRKGAGTNTAKTGICTGVGVFTIMEVREGKGSDAGWGRLKSGAGWISLDYCQRV